MAPPETTPVFISFDYDHDRALNTLLVVQSRNECSPFFIKDHSVRVEAKGWMDDARKRIQHSDLLIVVCGLYTRQAVGVTAEIEIAREEDVRYHLLKDRKEVTVRRPKGTSWLFDELHPWTWKELKKLTTVNEQRYGDARLRSLPTRLHTA